MKGACHGEAFSLSTLASRFIEAEEKKTIEEWTKNFDIINKESKVFFFHCM